MPRSSGQHEGKRVSPEQRRYLFIQCGVGAALVNALLNGGLGWAITKEFPTFPVWQLPGVGADLLATAFGVAFGTVLAMAVTVRLDAARGKIAPFVPPGSAAALVSRFPRATFSRSVVLGIVLYFWLAPGTEPVVHPVQSDLS